MSDMSDDDDFVSAADALSLPRSPPRRTPTTPEAPRTARIQIVPSPVSNLDEYEYVEGSDKVYKILKEHENVDGLEYEVMFWDTHTETVCELFAVIWPLNVNGHMTCLPF